MKENKLHGLARLAIEADSSNVPRAEQVLKSALEYISGLAYMYADDPGTALRLITERLELVDRWPEQLSPGDTVEYAMSLYTVDASPKDGEVALLSKDGIRGKVPLVGVRKT